MCAHFKILKFKIVRLKGIIFSKNVKKKEGKIHILTFDNLKNW